MNNFIEGLNKTTTENGREAYHSTKNFCLDLFYKIGASRGKDISSEFHKAMKEDGQTTLKILLWARDIRGGAGERKQFHDLIKLLIEGRAFTQDYAGLLAKAIIEVGRFDDLKVFFGSVYEPNAVRIWVSAINEGNGLAAKWSPRKDKKGAKPFRKVMNMTESEWRKHVVAKTDVVEQKMCAKNWSAIDYSKLPSVASGMYRKAFSKQDADRYVSYLQALERGDKEVKVNAGAIYPYQAIKNGRIGEAQWKALPDYIGDSNESFLPVIDSSGSMHTSVADGVQAIDVAISLGLYCAERNKSAFNDVVITFAGNPKLHKIQMVGLANRVAELSHLDWDMSTDIDKVYARVLDHALANNVTADEMPTKLLIISDMQFNRCIAGRGSLGAWRAKYEARGYKFPSIVFWNVNDRSGSIPVKAEEEGTALVSGFSPAIMTALLGGATNPTTVMMSALEDVRYDVSSYK